MNPRAIASVPGTVVGGRMLVRGPVPVTRLRKLGTSEPALSSVSRIPRRPCLPVPDRRMFHGNGSRRRPRANRGENKARRDVHTRAARSAENMVYGTTRFSCTYKDPRVSDPARAQSDVLIWTRSRGETRCAKYIPTSQRECRRNCLLEVVVICGAPCRRRLQILYRGNLVRINIFNLRTSERMEFICSFALARYDEDIF